MPNILEQIRNGVVLWDGGMGTMLMDLGLVQGECPELWNQEHPKRVQSVHTAYFEAGCDVIQTNTFGGSRLKLEVHGLGDSTYELNRKAAKLALEVCPEGKFVAGDIGPTGKFLAPSGAYEVEDFVGTFAEQAAGLVDGGVHFLSVETMFDLEEAKAAISGIRNVSSLPIVAQVTFNKTKRGFFTMMGNDVAVCMKSLIEAGADVVGSNCSLESADMVELVKLMKEHAKETPLIAQANAGQPTLVDGKTAYPTKPEDYIKDIEMMLNAGLSAVGGCCGTNPEFIAAMRKLIDERGPK